MASSPLDPPGTADNQDDVIDPDVLDSVSLIQRVYRGYRTRRELQGRRLTATNRWIDTVREAQGQQRQCSTTLSSKSPGVQAHHNWKRAVRATKLARGDGELEGKSPRPSAHSANMVGKPMDIQYFLEMVDIKHRHGSNLRKYHAFWKATDSKENFFYWLDHGAGKDVELPNCGRKQLEKEQVRYLSQAERTEYLVKIDQAGRFRWVKNNELIWTNNARYRDSATGIVPADTDSPGATNPLYPQSESISTSSLDEDKLRGNSRSGKRVKSFLHRRRRIIKHIKQKLFSSDDWWIFVADPSYRLYVGIKKRGYFQHSSFLRGGRIGAAGLVKIRDGQLRDLAPLSGHYRPPSANFHAFVHALQHQGADLSRVSITKLYATLAGMEGYMGAKQNVHHAQEKIKQKIEP